MGQCNKNMCRFGVKVADLDKEMFYIIYDPLTKLDDFWIFYFKISHSHVELISNMVLKV